MKSDIRNNSMNRLNILSNKRLRKANLEYLHYSQLKKNTMAYISGINYRKSMIGDININKNNKNKFTIIHRGKSK